MAASIVMGYQMVFWLKSSTVGHTPNDADMGLDDTELPLGAPDAAPAEAPQAAAP